MQLNQLAQHLLALPEGDRRYLADILEDSLWSETETQAWLRELERRSDAYDRGEVSGMSIEEAMRSIREQLDVRQAARDKP